MSTKPATTYTAVAKSVTTYNSIAKNRTTYSTATKNATTFSSVAKNATSFAANTSVASWLLNSTLVTLNSVVYLLNGYTTATAPNQLGNKPATSYA